MPVEAPRECTEAGALPPVVSSRQIFFRGRAFRDGVADPMQWSISFAAETSFPSHTRGKESAEGIGRVIGSPGAPGPETEP
jgi:hypothetical protein